MHTEFGEKDGGMRPVGEQWHGRSRGRSNNIKIVQEV